MQDDIREQFSRLLQICKMYQVRALTLNHALAKIGQLTPTDRASLTKAKIEDLIQEQNGDAINLTNNAAASLEKALAQDRDIIDWLKAYPGMVEGKISKEFYPR